MSSVAGGAWSQLVITENDLTAESRISAEQVERYIEELKGDCPSAEAREWHQAGWRRYDEARGELTLEQAFGLMPQPGERSWRTWAAEARKRRALLEAWHAVTSENVSAWSRSGMLAVEIRRFESTDWPQLRPLATAPRGSSALRAALFELFTAGGAQIPRGQRRINDVVAEALSLQQLQ